MWTGLVDRYLEHSMSLHIRLLHSSHFVDIVTMILARQCQVTNVTYQQEHIRTLLSALAHEAK